MQTVLLLCPVTLEINGGYGKHSQQEKHSRLLDAKPHVARALSTPTGFATSFPPPRGFTVCTQGQLGHGAALEPWIRVLRKQPIKKEI